MARLPEKDGRKDPIAGCLLGVAIGDALGAPFEHLPPGKTCRLLEKTGGRVLDFHGSWNGPKGGWTDDTCLTLAACQGFLETVRTGGPIASALHRALRNVGADPGFRRTGKTILNTVLTGFPDVDAWSNGALMRIAPAAAYAVLAKASRTQAAHLALFLARLPHGHPLAVFPALECTLALFPLIIIGIPRAFDMVKHLLREGAKDLGEEIADFLIHRLASEETRVAVSHLLDLLDSGNASVSEAAAYVLVWAGAESVIPHIKRAYRRHRSRRMIQEAQMVLQGKHKELSASMGYFRALHPITRRLIDRARKIHEQKQDQERDGP